MIKTARLKKNIVKTPLVLQMETQECGAACLSMILAYYKKWVPLEEVRSDCAVSRDGSKASNIYRAAKYYGMEGKVEHLDLGQLESEACFPCILEWKNKHFVVCNGIRDGKVYLNDPANGRAEIDKESFQKSYSGLCLHFQPGPEFRQGGKPKSIWKFFLTRTRNNRKALVLVLITAFLAASAGVIIPGFSNMYTDIIVNQEAQPDLVRGFLILFGIVIAFQLLSQMFHILMINRVTGKMGSTSNLGFLWHILRMPMKFYAQRLAGDLTARQMENDLVASTLVGMLVPTMIQTVFLVFYLVAMLNYSVILTFIGLVTILANLLISRRVVKRGTDRIRVRVRDEGLLTSNTLSGIHMIETIKSLGAEQGFFERWSGLYAVTKQNRSWVSSLNRMFKPLPAFLQQISSVIILTVGTWMIMDGRITFGIFLAFQATVTAFNAPVNRLISAEQEIQQMHSYMERIDDVMKYPVQLTQDRETVPEQILMESERLSGDIELQHVTFGYSALSKPLITDLSLKIRPGSRIAVVGASGSGKSTIARLIAGLYDPWEGKITFDGKERSEIPRPVFTASVSVVDQDITLFADTIENNIKMWDTTISDSDMFQAARDAEIHDSILHRRDGYRGKLEENGQNLSGGQRQRLEIARVLAGNPTILIMDEATSALDTFTEYQVSEAIRRRGITCIIIAHRLSAIRDCDEILVLNHGQITERGTHEELLSKNGVYARLVGTA